MTLKKHAKPTPKELQEFIERHLDLLRAERAAEEEQTHLLNSNCSPRLLEQRGLAVGSLGVSTHSIGLGGKTLVELHRPPAYNTASALPSHTFRSGDPVRIEPHVAGNESGKKTKAKLKKAEDDADAVEGVISRIFENKIIVAIDEGKDVNLPERLRILKLANSVTFDRLEKNLAHLSRLITKAYPQLTAEGDVQGAAKPVDGAGDEQRGDTQPSPGEEETTADDAGASPPTVISGAFAQPQPSLPAPQPLPQLVEALLGLSAPSWQAEAVTSDDIQWYDESLNQSQREAVRFCLSAEQVACIHGPPGTGKTHTLIELILQLLSRPAHSNTALPPRILIATPSNLALDNILLRLQQVSTQSKIASLLPPGAILRLGHPTRVHKDLLTQTLDWRASNGNGGEVVKGVKAELEGHMSDLGKKHGEKGAVKGKDRGVKWQEVRELRKEYRQREAKVVKNVVAAAQVVLATCHGAGSRQINNLAFDICIIDEATQAIEAACWIPALRSKRLILAGDPQQLPPTIMSKPGKIKKSDIPQKATLLNTLSEVQAPELDTSDNAQSGTSKTISCQPEVHGKDEAHLEAAEQPEDDGLLEPGFIGADSTTSRASQLLPPRTLERTLFERLEKAYGSGIKRVLTTQYRMNKQIAAFPSAALYNDALVSADAVKDRTLLGLPTIIDPEAEESKDTLSHPVVFFDTAGCEFFEMSDADSALEKSRSTGDGSRSNANEAEVVLRWTRELISLGVPAKDIGIVTPYQAQVSLLSAQLHAEYPEMTIGSVDGLQGQEREAIIVSLVRSNPTGEVGFLSEYRRMNVAMTRAKRQLCVVGDSATVSKGSDYLKNWMAWLEAEADVRWAGEGQ